MTTAIALRRLCCSVLMGGCLGIFSGFLRPLGRRHRISADLLFSAGAVWAWLFICFAVCQGDIRTVYLLGMGGGILLWEETVGLRLRPVFDRIWRICADVLGIFLFPLKKFLEIAKILFASGEKWVTIKCIKIFRSRKKRRKETHGKNEHPAQKCESGSSSRIQYP